MKRLKQNELESKKTCGEKFRQWFKGGQVKNIDDDEGDFVKVYKTQYKFDKHDPSWDPC